MNHQAIPRNGGEKNYIEYLIRQPRYLASSAYAVNAAILGWAAGNSVVCGEYILRAANQDNPGQWTRRLIGFGAITIAFILHGTSVRTGLYVQNILGASKLILLVFVAATGLYALQGPLQVEKPDNFSHIWEGTTASMSSFCLSLYNVRV
jgi:amino acid transporter